MILFPTKKYSIDLLYYSSEAIVDLKQQTLSDEQFVSDWNKQVIIGKINESEFEIKLSKKLYGTFCFLKGKLEKKNGTLEIGINKIFKVILLVLFLFPII